MNMSIASGRMEITIVTEKEKEFLKAWELSTIDDFILAPRMEGKIKTREWIVEHPEEFIDIMVSSLEAEYGD